jgi:phosphotransferase system  glucose/maltose/N-acetylglucosamine-specific IIC component
MFIDKLVGKSFALQGGGSVTLTFNMVAHAPLNLDGGAAFPGVNPGQYMQGKYPFMMFGLVAAAAAMIIVVPKGDSRKQAFSIIGSAALTSFLTGITEPLEFTFLFLAPYMF